MRVLPFGKRYGQREDYGHYDLLVGRHAPSEAWPRILEWLDRGARKSEQDTASTDSAALL